MEGYNTEKINDTEEKRINFSISLLKLKGNGMYSSQDTGYHFLFLKTLSFFLFFFDIHVTNTPGFPYFTVSLFLLSYVVYTFVGSLSVGVDPESSILNPLL